MAPHEDFPAPNVGRWRDLGIRCASALVLAPALILCLWFGGIVWVALTSLAGVVMIVEWRTMAERMPEAGKVAWILVWIVPAYLALIVLRRSPDGFASVLFVFCVVWASDIGAYVVGRLVGGPKLAPAVSPGKTRSGAIGGLVAAVGVGLLFARGAQGDYGVAALAAGSLGVAAQTGDLLESAVKRHFGVKDSGNLIPGHGGLLDRLDAVLTAAPLAAIITAWRGVELWR